jgi:hypothetical protein
VTLFSSLRARGRAAVRPSTALIGSVLFAFGWLGPTGQTIAVFGALRLLADALMPASPSVDADEHFHRVVRARRRARGLGRSAPLDLLDPTAGLKRGRRDLGVQTINLDAIVGTVEPAKARVFDRQLRPDASCADRWKRLWSAYRRGDPVPPVSVYRFDGRFWLCDGHDRVSVRRHQGAPTIDALVTEL